MVFITTRQFSIEKACLVYNNVTLNRIAVVMNANSRIDAINNFAVIKEVVIKRVRCNQKITNG